MVLVSCLGEDEVGTKNVLHFKKLRNGYFDNRNILRFLKLKSDDHCVIYYGLWKLKKAQGGRFTPLNPFLI